MAYRLHRLFRIFADLCAFLGGLWIVLLLFLFLTGCTPFLSALAPAVHDTLFPPEKQVEQ